MRYFMNLYRKWSMQKNLNDDLNALKHYESFNATVR